MTQLGKFTLIRKLANGGMAEVHLAVTSGPGGFQKSLVIKRIHPHLAEDPRFVEMFFDEARLAAQLSHPNIVQIFDFGLEDGRYFLAMELVDGPNLRTVLEAARARGQALDAVVCARLIATAAEALAYAHDFRDPTTDEALNLVHRDLSPDNLLLDRNGTLKVTDFGVAKSGGATHRTNAGVVKGKLAYMAPEQLQGQAVTRAADIYALGVVLYELLTGALPYEGTAEGELVQGILTGKRVPLASRRAEVPEVLQEIVSRALSKEASRRYPDCHALARELERFVASSGVAIDSRTLGQLVAELAPGPSMKAERAATSPLLLTKPAHTTLDEGIAPTSLRSSDPSMAAFLGVELDTPYENTGGMALGADGRVEGKSEAAKRGELTTTAHEVAAPPGSEAFRPAEPESMELATPIESTSRAPEDTRPLDEGRVTEAKLRGRRRFFIAVAVTLVLAAAAVLSLPWLKSADNSFGDFVEPALLVVDSVPSGAQVIISGKSAGKTPLAIDNIWPEGQVPIEVRLQGYKPWRGTFRGKEAQQVDAMLSR